MSARPRFTSTGPNRDPDGDAASAAAARRRAVRVVAAHGTGVEDCRDLLDMLGLHSAAGLPPVGARGEFGEYLPPQPGRR